MLVYHITEMGEGKKSYSFGWSMQTSIREARPIAGADKSHLHSRNEDNFETLKRYCDSLAIYLEYRCLVTSVLRNLNKNDNRSYF